MRDRIKKVIESQHMTQQEFAECIKVAPATLSSIFTGRTAPSLKVVEAIKGRFPDISTDWLMFGKGSMVDAPSADADGVHDSPLPSEKEAKVDFGDESDVPAVSLGAGSGRDIGTARASGAAVAAVVGGRKNAGGQSAIGGFQMVNNCDKSTRRIVEIRIFYDDQTWETFVPKK